MTTSTQDRLYENLVSLQETGNLNATSVVGFFREDLKACALLALSATNIEIFSVLVDRALEWRKNTGYLDGRDTLELFQLLAIECARWGWLEGMEKLVAVGGDDAPKIWEATNDFEMNKTPLILAATYGYTLIVNLIKQFAVPVHQLFALVKAAQNQQAEVVKTLIDDISIPGALDSQSQKTLNVLILSVDDTPNNEIFSILLSKINPLPALDQLVPAFDPSSPSRVINCDDYIPQIQKIDQLWSAVKPHHLSSGRNIATFAATKGFLQNPKVLCHAPLAKAAASKEGLASELNHTLDTDRPAVLRVTKM